MRAHQRIADNGPSWAEQHLGISVQFQEQTWFLVDIVNGLAVLEDEDEERRVSVSSERLRRVFAAQNLGGRT